MKCLVTGATGFIGNRLVEKLLDLGFEVNVIVRSPDKLSDSIRNKIHVFKGDVLDKNTINSAIVNCNQVYHLAAFAGIWSKDQLLPYKINVTGTENLLKAALDHNIQKIAFTSSAGTLAPSKVMEEVNEASPLPETYHTDYEKSKLKAEQLCMDYIKKGLCIVIVNPTRVFGPGPMNKSNSVTVMIRNYLAGYWRFIPGKGESVGNYAFIDDVAEGHIKAMEVGVCGEKYILGGTNISFNAFFKHLAAASGMNLRMIHIPYLLIYALASVEFFLAGTFVKKPIITPPWARRYNENRLVSSNKAIEHLRYNITPVRLAMEKTIQWLQQQNGHEI